MQKQINRGEIWIVELPLSKGSIQRGMRPAIVVSCNPSNQSSEVLYIVSVTSKNKKWLPTHIPVSKKLGLLADSTALCEQPLPVCKEDFIRKIGECDNETMSKISMGLSIHFALMNDIVQEINNTQYA